MKLYLSSYRIPNPGELERLIGKPLSMCKVALIPNAKDYTPDSERSQKINELQSDLVKLDIKADIVDLRYYNDPDSLENTLKTYELVWVAGGNCFVLRFEMQRSGFETIIAKLLRSGLVYGGESAGAIVAGASLHGFEAADDPASAAKLIKEGLRLTKKVIAPHMDNAEFADYTKHIQNLYAGDERIIYLSDNQALVINNDMQVVVSGET